MDKTLREKNANFSDPCITYAWIKNMSLVHLNASAPVWPCDCPAHQQSSATFWTPLPPEGTSPGAAPVFSSSKEGKNVSRALERPGYVYIHSTLFPFTFYKKDKNHTAFTEYLTLSCKMKANNMQ